MTERTSLPTVAGWWWYYPRGDEFGMTGQKRVRAHLHFQDDYSVKINCVWHRLDQLPGEFDGPIEDDDEFDA